MKKEKLSDADLQKDSAKLEQKKKKKVKTRTDSTWGAQES